jgi:hypothetical protein
MKVKILRGNDPMDLEEKINSFIEGRDVIQIEFKVVKPSSEFYFYALISYEVD